MFKGECFSTGMVSQVSRSSNFLGMKTWNVELPLLWGVCEKETVNKGFPTKGKLGAAQEEEPQH